MRWTAPSGRDERKLCKALIKIIGVFGFEGDFDLIVRNIQHGIGTEQKLWILEQKIVHEAGDDSFTLPDIYDFEEVGRIAKSFFDGVKAFLEYFGNSRKDEDIIDFYHRGEEGISC